uniref:Uncharacterized protein n=1 Tax=viral metagenome TaxID=1070528 RepID=A0A6M3KTQ2_9ZZZZ
MPLSKKANRERMILQPKKEILQPKSDGVTPEIKAVTFPIPVTPGKTRPNRMGANGSPEMVVNEYGADERLSDGRMRYLGPLSDGQCLDRTTVPLVDKTMEMYRAFLKCRMFTPNAEQLRENGIDLQRLKNEVFRTGK